MRNQALLSANLRLQDLQHYRQHYRQHYNPQADRLPRWLHRVWAWF